LIAVQSSSGLKLKPGLEQRLSVAQQQRLYTNRVLLQLLAGRHQSARDLTQQLLRRSPPPLLPPSLQWCILKSTMTTKVPAVELCTQFSGLIWFLAATTQRPI